MSSFSLTYRETVDHDIKYLYCGRPASMKWRNSGDYPNLDMLRLQRENHEMRQDIILNRVTPYSRHYPKHAGAFREFKPQKVNEVVDRLLSSKTLAFKGRPLTDSSDYLMMVQRRKSNPTWAGGLRRPSASQQQSSISRLSNPYSTHMSRLKFEKNIQNIVMDINGKISSNSLVIGSPGCPKNLRCSVTSLFENYEQPS